MVHGGIVGCHGAVGTAEAAHNLLNIVTGGGSGGPTLSKNNISHIRKHIPSEFAKQTPYMTPNQIDKFLSKNSFFNPGWAKDQVISGVEQAYQELTKKGLTGLQDFELHGETIKLFIKSDGTLDTAYGLHKLDNSFFD